MEKISVQANRAQCAAHLIFHWVDDYLGKFQASDPEQHIESVKRVARLVRASLCAPSGNYPLMDEKPSQNGESWSEMIGLEFVHGKALLDGPGSDAHQWLNSLPGYRWDQSGRDQLEITMEHHGYCQMLSSRIIDPAWRLAGAYCDDENPWRDLGMGYAKSLPINPFLERIDWADIEKFNAQNRACIERDTLIFFVDRPTNCQPRLVKSL